MSKMNLRSLKYGSNTAILIIAVVAIALLVNILVGIPDLKLDLTPNKLYSLSDVTQKELEKLDKEVEIIGLFDDGLVGSSNPYKEVTELLDLYDKYPNITVTYIDPVKNPGIIKELDPEERLGLQNTNFVVRSTVNGKTKSKKLEYYDMFAMQMNQYTLQPQVTGSTAEQSFTGAIRYVTSEKTPVIYFTEGHDEPAVDQYFTSFKDALERNNFEVSKINLLTVEAVPEDAALVVVMSPGKDFTLREREVLDEYLYKGGDAVFMFDYESNDPDYTQINELLKEYNVTVNYDKVKETDDSRHIPQDEYTLLVNAPSNDIVKYSYTPLISSARSIGILRNDKDFVKVKSLMKTSDTAIGEMVDKSRGEDIPGPLDIAIAVEHSGRQNISKVLVFGNTLFISDSAYQAFGYYFNTNMNFFFQALSWAVEMKDDIIAPTKNYEVNQIQITESQARLIGGALIIILPLLVLGTGMAVFLRRRHL